MDVLTVVFGGCREFLAQERNLARGWMLLPRPDPLPDALTDLILRVCTPAGSSAEFKARVIQIVGGSGIAVGFEDLPAVGRQFAGWFERARAEGESTGPTTVFWGRAPVEAEPAPPVGEDEDTGAPSGGTDERQSALLIDQIRAMNTQQRMHLAAHGDRAARLILVKDTNKTIQTFVLQNPHVTIDEVRGLAGMRQASPDALQMIGAHREWSQNPGVVAALVRNPKTPLSVAVRMLDRLPATELRRIAKSNDTPRGVALAARKKVVGLP